MHRFLFHIPYRFCLAVSLAAMAMLAPLAPALAATAIVLKPIQVSPHVYYFQGEPGMASAANKGFMSNAGFVVTADGVVVFDALATPALGEAMLTAIAAVTPQPVKLVVISHYHADHFYGLQAFKARGAQVWAHANGNATLHSDLTQERLAQRRTDLAPWVNQQTHLVPADRWLDFTQDKTIPFTMGGMHFRLIDSSGAHSPEDIMMFVDEERVLFAGDLFFTGRIPFVGGADSKVWLHAMERMLATDPVVVIPGHGKMSSQPLKDMQLTRDYLIFLRQQMGAAVNDLTPFEEAYDKVDWSRFEQYPAFRDANRINAYGTYLLMEKESLAK